MWMFITGGLLIAVVVGAIAFSVTIGRNMGLVCATAGIFLIGLTFVQARYSDRWASSNITSEEFARCFKNVPKVIGDWEAEELKVKDEVRETAGAVGYVSRAYQNTKTGQTVTLWLIVGHARDICRHTPDICYPSSGFHKQSKENVPYTMAFDDAPPSHFWTNSFIREDRNGRALERVFWSWYKPNENSAVKWVAPEHQRWIFGNARALYKMYFSSQMPSPKQTADESACIEFAQRFLPQLENALLEQDVEPNDQAAASS